MIKKYNLVSKYLRAAAIIMCSVFILSRVITSSLAKYTKSDIGTDQGIVATFYVGSNSDKSVISIPLSSETTTCEFSIVNFIGDEITEVAYNYDFTVSTLDNLPINVTVTPKGTSDQLATVTGLFGTNGTMPCDSKSTHTYVVTISLDTTQDDYNDYKYTEEIDILIIDFHCEQIN